MQDFKHTLAQEQPPIAAALTLHAAQLPPGSRPVAEYVLQAGGKRLRPFLTVITGRALGCTAEALYTLGAAIELLHAATLLHDDILDNATLRRSRPAAHTVFAPTHVILAGDAMLAKAMLMVSAFGDPRLTDCISQAVMRTAEGQINEFSKLRDTDLSHDDYLDVITGKTAWMLRAACELGALLAGADAPVLRAAATFGLELGIAFQMVDDALDFSPEEQTGKPTGGDLKEGKVTPPLLLYMGSRPPEEAEDFKKRFRANALAPDALDAVSRSIFDEGHAAATRRMAKRHLDAAAAALALFPDTAERLVLQQMLDYIKNRER